MSRQNYWLAVIPITVVGLLLDQLGFELLLRIFGAYSLKELYFQASFPFWTGIVLYNLQILVALQITFFFWTHTVRRFHDAGLSGWWILLFGDFPIPYLSIVTVTIFLYLLLKKSNPAGMQKYGKTVPATWGIKLAWIVLPAIFLLIVNFPDKHNPQLSLAPHIYLVREKETISVKMFARNGSAISKQISPPSTEFSFYPSNVENSIRFTGNPENLNFDREESFPVSLSEFIEICNNIQEESKNATAQ